MGGKHFSRGYILDCIGLNWIGLKCRVIPGCDYDCKNRKTS